MRLIQAPLGFGVWARMRSHHLEIVGTLVRNKQGQVLLALYSIVRGLGLMDCLLTNHGVLVAMLLLGLKTNLYGQPFVAYTNKHAWTFTLETQAQYNYDAHRTTNPLYMGVSKLEVFDKLPVQFSAGPTYYISNAPGGPSGWGGRGTITFVFPK